MDVIEALASVMRRDIESLNSLARNAANANTAGYRTERAFRSSGATWLLNEVPKTDPALMQTLSNRDGVLDVTHRSLDVALRGDAWFVLDTPEGARLTRDGRFSLDADRVLRSPGGFAVRFEQGAVVIPPGEVRFDAQGRLSVDNRVIGQLVLARPVAGAEVVAEGAGLYRTARFEPDTKAQLVQGAVERANVDVADDMVRMMETTRHIESVQRAMVAYDQIMNTGINQLGK